MMRKIIAIMVTVVLAVILMRYVTFYSQPNSENRGDFAPGGCADRCIGKPLRIACTKADEEFTPALVGTCHMVCIGTYVNICID
ncbi:MAG: hypothetical protein AAB909_00765 [Patescibacteria group bacterium]